MNGTITTSQARWISDLNRVLPGFFLSTILLFSSSVGMAAELNITENQLPVVLGPYLDHLEDPERRFTIEDIMAMDSGWQRLTQTTPTLGLSQSAHWFNLILSGDVSQRQDLIISVDSATLDRIEFYMVQDGQVISQSVAGDSISFAEIEQPYRIPIIPFTMDPNGQRTQIYIRATSLSGLEIPISLTTMALLASQQQSQLAFFGALFVFFFLSFATCSVLYYYLREKQFLGYALFFGSLTVFLLAFTGMGRVWFWGSIAEMNNRVSFVSTVLLIASFCLFGQALTLTGKYRDSINIVLRFLAYAMIPVGIYFAVIPMEQIHNDNILTIIYLTVAVIMLVFIMTGITAVQGSKTALYLFATWALILAAYLSTLGYKFALFEMSPSLLFVDEMIIALASIMLLFSLAEFVRSKNEEFAQVRLETKAKGDFLKNVSREFLTPVHLILANSKRLLAAQSNKLDETTQQHMNTVIKQSNHLHQLINDLLEMAELESDNFEPEFELVEISHFLTEIRDMMLPSAMEKYLDFNTEFASANLLVQTDKSRLQHALVNIITNAIKFTDQGNIKLGYKAVYFKRRLGIEISIKDTGRGMSDEFQKRMFEEFAQEEAGSEKEPGGTGLGMVIVKRMIEKLGGEIEFESVENIGSEFFIRLPLRVNPS